MVGEALNFERSWGFWLSVDRGGRFVGDCVVILHDGQGAG